MPQADIVRGFGSFIDRLFLFHADCNVARLYLRRLPIQLGDHLKEKDERRMTPEQAKVVGDFLIADFEHEMQVTLKVLAAVPADHLDYQPDAKSSTGLGLIRHIPVLDAWLLNSIANGTFDGPPEQPEACGISTPEDAIACYKERVPAALERVRGLSAEQMAGIIDFFGVMQVPAVTLIQLTIKHSVHHRGQLSSYLRSMGGKVPGIYGSSADK
jgi:uncharacterized damage-inducible protein DinB